MTTTTPPAPPIERRLQLSGILVILGLIVELLSLFWVHPLAFLGFTIIGGALLLAGFAVYLVSLVRSPGPEEG
jgi:hypothetical protein